MSRHSIHLLPSDPHHVEEDFSADIGDDLLLAAEASMSSLTGEFDPFCEKFTQDHDSGRITGDPGSVGCSSRWDAKRISEAFGNPFGELKDAARPAYAEPAFVKERFPTPEDGFLWDPALENSSQELSDLGNDVFDISSTPLMKLPEILIPSPLTHEAMVFPTPPDSGRLKRVCADLGGVHDQKRTRFNPQTASGSTVMASITRSPIPPLVMPRPLVDGLVADHYLKSCFRIVDAIHLAESGDIGVRDTGMLELFARVSFSSRVPFKQNFRFVDLFHDQPPFLNGYSLVYKGHELWVQDADAFLEADVTGKIARAVGKLRSIRTTVAGATLFIVEVFSIQEYSWADVRELFYQITGTVLGLE